MSHAFHISSSLASKSPHFKLDSIVPLNKTFFCKTTATLSLKVFKSYCLTSFPATEIEPSLTSYKREIKLTNDVLPLPVLPKIPTNWPDLIWILRFSKVFFSAVSTYLKSTLSNTTSPLSTLVIAFSGFLIIGSSTNTSYTRLIDSIDMTIIRRIMETNNKEVKI